MYLTAHGHDSSAFLKSQGVDPQVFRNPEARIPHSVAASLWPAPARLANDPDLGLHVAEGYGQGTMASWTTRCVPVRPWESTCSDSAATTVSSTTQQR